MYSVIFILYFIMINLVHIRCPDMSTRSKELYTVGVRNICFKPKNEIIFHVSNEMILRFA